MRPGAGTRKTPERPPASPERPLVSVVIACYNYGRFLDDSVGSCLVQRDVDVQVVLVDDLSTDDSLAHAERLATAHDDVELVASPVNRGPVGAFNTGLEFVRGDFVVRLDADDLLTPGSLARAMQLFAALPGVGFAYGRPLHFEDEPPQVSDGPAREWWIYRSAEWIERRARVGSNALTSPEAVLRREVVDTIGGMDPGLPHGHDMEYWLRAASVADVGWIDGPYQALHREHPASRFLTQVSTWSNDLYERRQVFDAYFSSQAGLPYRRFQALASRTLAKEALELAARDCDKGLPPELSEQECRELAMELDPTIEQSLAWRTLGLRRAAGRDRAQFLPTAFGGPALRRARTELIRRRWERTGT